MPLGTHPIGVPLGTHPIRVPIWVDHSDLMMAFGAQIFTSCHRYRRIYTRLQVATYLRIYVFASITLRAYGLCDPFTLGGSTIVGGRVATAGSRAAAA